MARIDWTRICVEAPGLRPTASEAAMPIKPTATAAPIAAKPTCMLPIISLVLPFPAPPRLNMFIRRKSLSLFAHGFFFLMWTHQQSEHRAQKNEHHPLHQAHEHFHEIKRDRQEPPEGGDLAGHGFQHVFPGKDVAVKTKTQ